MNEHRVEHDSMGEVHVPHHAYYGAQTQRAVENFPISGWRLPDALIRALGLVKYAAAVANRDLGRLSGRGKHALDAKHIEALLAAAREVAEGKLAEHFPIDVFQTGSGTSSNMNVNEVIATRAAELLGHERASKSRPIHPNDHVNMGQSTNDMFPTAIHVAVAVAIQRELIPALDRLRDVLEEKSQEWDKIIKIGRTHLADATPIRLGQVFSGFVKQLDASVERAYQAIRAVRELPAGGTAVGTGINTHPEFGSRVAEVLSQETGIEFEEATNHFEANANRDGVVECSGELKTIAVSLFTIANNIRWLGSGPRCGFYEVILPDRQPGSSIMPGKVNPVMSESTMQVCARVIGNDQTIAFAGATGSNFELNIMMPIMGHVALESVELLASSVQAFTEFCALEMEANRQACESSVEQSLSMVTSLNPHIGYEKAAALAKEAFKTGKTIRQLAEEQKILPDEVLREALDPWRMTEPHE